MIDDSVLEALRTAATNEQKTREFYLQSAERVKDACGREMFLSLAEEELNHLKMVQRQYEALAGGEDWVEFAEAAAAEEFKPLEARKVSEKPVDPMTSDRDALLFAIQLEHDSYELYMSEAERVDSPAGKQMYRHLANAERRHFEILMSNYEHVTSTGGFLGLGTSECE